MYSAKNDVKKIIQDIKRLKNFLINTIKIMFVRILISCIFLLSKTKIYSIIRDDNS